MEKSVNLVLFIYLLIVLLLFASIMHGESHKKFKDSNGHTWYVKTENYQSCNTKTDSLILIKSPELMDFKIECLPNKSK